jgi:hypothetical protein
MMFIEFHLKHPAHMNDTDRDAYNTAAARQLDDFRRFINLHYVSERRDTPFWKHVANDCILPETRVRLAHWQNHMPNAYDFVRLPGNFAHVEEQLHYPVLDGLGLLNRETAKREMDKMPEARKAARNAVESLKSEYVSAARQTLGHRAFLESLQ